MSRWKYSFKARNPHDLTGVWEVGIAEELCRYFVNNGHEKSQARIVLVHEVLEECTQAIYGGWCRPNKEDCFVYVGNPEFDWHKLDPQICVASPPGMVFLVFVLSDGTVDDWTWRKHDENDLAIPNGAAGELIWRIEN